MRRGGTKRLTAEELDERLEFLAAQLSSGISDTSGGAGLNCLRDNLDESLGLFVEMLKEPRFQEDRLALAKEQALQDMKKRNDDAADIEAREWSVLLNGEDHFTNRFTTEASVTRHHPRRPHGLPPPVVPPREHGGRRVRLVLAGGDAREAREGVRGLAHSSARASPRARRPSAPRRPASTGSRRTSTRAGSRCGLPTVRRDSPDIYALEVMNEILGGSGFSSRITRSCARTRASPIPRARASRFGVYYPGRFRAGFQSKSRSVPYATPLVLQEIRKIREAPVSGRGAGARQGQLDRHLSLRASPPRARRMGVFAADEYTKRDPSFWATYRDRIRAVTAADVSARGPRAPGPGEDGPARGGQPQGDRPGRRRPRGLAREARPGGEGDDARASGPDDDEEALSALSPS